MIIVFILVGGGGHLSGAGDSLSGALCGRVAPLHQGQNDPAPVFSRQHADHPGYGGALGGQIELVNGLNMYYIAKIAQAAGLTVMLIGFLTDFRD